MLYVSFGQWKTVSAFRQQSFTSKRCSGLVSYSYHSNTPNSTSVLQPTFYTIGSEATFSESIKKSKFVAKVAKVNSFKDALEYVQKVKDSKATHNCWAYVTPTWNHSCDDGEVSGTAGKPILNSLVTEQIVHAVVVVTRYYGGIKLGTGGLIRAYSSAAKGAIANAHKVAFVATSKIQLAVPINDIGIVYQLILQYSARDSNNFYKVSEEYICEGLDDSNNDTGNEQLYEYLQVILSLPSHDVSSFESRIQGACKGKGRFTVLHEEIAP